jgi:hypothetical protein
MGFERLHLSILNTLAMEGTSESTGCCAKIRQCEK